MRQTRFLAVILADDEVSSVVGLFPDRVTGVEALLQAGPASKVENPLCGLIPITFEHVPLPAPAPAPAPSAPTSDSEAS